MDTDNSAVIAEEGIGEINGDGWRLIWCGEHTTVYRWHVVELCT